MQASADYLIELKTERECELQRMPSALDIAAALIECGAVSSNELEKTALSDLFSSGFCAKPLTYEGLIIDDPELRSWLKRVKSAKYLDLDRIFSTDCSADEAELIALVAEGGAVIREGHISLAKRGLSSLPVKVRLSPRSETPMVYALNGSFNFFINADGEIIKRLCERESITLCTERFTIGEVKAIKQISGSALCLQTDAAPMLNQKKISEKAFFRLKYDAERGCRMVCGSVLSKNDGVDRLHLALSGKDYSFMPFMLNIMTK